MFLPEGLNWLSSSHWSTSISIKLQNTLHPICPSMLFSLWSCITLARALKFQFQFVRADANRRPPLAFWDASAPEIESDKVRDGGGEVDKSGCSPGWREKMVWKEINSWSRNKSMIQELLCELGNFFKVRSPISLSVCSAALSACFLSFSKSLTDTPRSHLFIFLPHIPS